MTDAPTDAPAARGPVAIATAADQNFAMQLAVLVASLGKSTPNAEFVVFILEDGFTRDTKERIHASAQPGTTLEWISAANVDTQRARINTHLTPATTFRLRLPELLPRELERVVYLDADVLVRQPLDGLVQTDLGDSLAAAVRDPASPWAAMSLPWRALGVDPAAPYFNTGILHIPVDRWRAEQVGPRAFDLLRQHQLRWGENCALNAVLTNRWRELHPRWNLQSAHLDELRPIWAACDVTELDAAVRDPSVVHLNNPARNRPWNQSCTNPFAAEWLARLDETPWAGWRPESPGRRRKATQRIKKTVYAALHG